MTKLFWLVAAVLFGTLARLCAHLAAEPSLEWVQWVLNWGALWAVVPFLASRQSTRAPAAVLTGGLVGGLEVVAYYGVGSFGQLEIGWMALGSIFCGLVGLCAASSTHHRLGMLALPALFALEPLGLSVMFLVLGRDLGPHWTRSAISELAVGLFSAGAVALVED